MVVLYRILAVVFGSGDFSGVIRTRRRTVVRHTVLKIPNSFSPHSRDHTSHNSPHRTKSYVVQALTAATADQLQLTAEIEELQELLRSKTAQLTLVTAKVNDCRTKIGLVKNKYSKQFGRMETTSKRLEENARENAQDLEQFKNNSHILSEEKKEVLEMGGRKRFEKKNLVELERGLRRLLGELRAYKAMGDVDGTRTAVGTRIGGSSTGVVGDTSGGRPSNDAGTSSTDPATASSDDVLARALSQGTSTLAAASTTLVHDSATLQKLTNHLEGLVQTRSQILLDDLPNIQKSQTLLEDAKKNAIAVRNFKEAGRLTAELKQLSEKKDSLENMLVSMEKEQLAKQSEVDAEKEKLSFEEKAVGIAELECDLLELVVRKRAVGKLELYREKVLLREGGEVDTGTENKMGLGRLLDREIALAEEQCRFLETKVAGAGPELVEALVAKVLKEQKGEPGPEEEEQLPGEDEDAGAPDEGTGAKGPPANEAEVSSQEVSARLGKSTAALVEWRASFFTKSFSPNKNGENGDEGNTGEDEDPDLQRFSEFLEDAKGSSSSSDDKEKDDTSPLTLPEDEQKIISELLVSAELEEAGGEEPVLGEEAAGSEPVVPAADPASPLEGGSATDLVGESRRTGDEQNAVEEVPEPDEHVPPPAPHDLKDLKDLKVEDVVDDPEQADPDEPTPNKPPTNDHPTKTDARADDDARRFDLTARLAELELSTADLEKTLATCETKIEECLAEEKYDEADSVEQLRVKVEAQLAAERAELEQLRAQLEESSSGSPPLRADGPAAGAVVPDGPAGRERDSDVE